MSNNFKVNNYYGVSMLVDNTSQEIDSQNKYQLMMKKDKKVILFKETNPTLDFSFNKLWNFFESLVDIKSDEKEFYYILSRKLKEAGLELEFKLNLKEEDTSYIRKELAKNIINKIYKQEACLVNIILNNGEDHEFIKLPDGSFQYLVEKEINKKNLGSLFSITLNNFEDKQINKTDTRKAIASYKYEQIEKEMFENIVYKYNDEKYGYTININNNVAFSTAKANLISVMYDYYKSLFVKNKYKSFYVNNKERTQSYYITSEFKLYKVDKDNKDKLEEINIYNLNIKALNYYNDLITSAFFN